MSGSGASSAGSLARGTTTAAAPGLRAAAAAAALAVASGLGLELALGAADWWLAAWLAPVPLLLGIRRARSAGWAYALAFTTGAVFWTLHVLWLLPLPGVNPVNYAVGMVVLAALFGVVGPLVWLARWAPAGTRWAALAAAWALAEYVRLHVGFASIPWGLLANSQVGHSPLAQVASFAGLYGVSFLILCGAAAQSEAIHAARSGRGLRGRTRWEVLAPLAVIGAALWWGAARVDSDASDPHATGPTRGNTLRVALVQGGTYDRHANPSRRRREVLEGYLEQTRRAVEEGVDLVAWPASSVPGAIPFDTGLVRILGRLSAEVATPLLVGSSGQQKSSPIQRARPTTNSAFLLDPRGEILGHYDKIQLLPFNEYLPARGVVPWPQWLAAGAMDAHAGAVRTVFELGDARFGVLICWEILFPDGFRAAVSQRLDFVASLTNEAFTHDRHAHRQMLVMNRLRAIENGIPVIRIATTGVTGAIDRFGRMSAVVSDSSGETQGVTGFRVADVDLGASRSFYARYGDVFVACCALALAIGAASGALRRRSVGVS